MPKKKKRSGNSVAKKRAALHQRIVAKNTQKYYDEARGSKKTTEPTAEEVAEKIHPYLMIPIEEYYLFFEDREIGIHESFVQEDYQLLIQMNVKNLDSIHLGESESFNLELPDRRLDEFTNSPDSFIATFRTQDMLLKAVFRFATADKIVSETGFVFNPIFDAIFMIGDEDKHGKNSRKKDSNKKLFCYQFSLVEAKPDTGEMIDFGKVSVKKDAFPFFTYDFKRLSIADEPPEYVRAKFAEIAYKMFFNALEAFQNVPKIEGEHHASSESSSNHKHTTVTPGHDVELVSRIYPEKAEKSDGEKTRTVVYECPKWQVRGYSYERKLKDGRIIKVNVPPYVKGRERNNPDVQIVTKNYIRKE